jgi:hypothetical protein
VHFLRRTSGTRPDVLDSRPAVPGAPESLKKFTSFQSSGLGAGRRFGHQCQAHVAGAGVHAVLRACQVAAGQHAQAGVGIQVPGEGQIVAAGHRQPQAKAAVRPCHAAGKGVHGSVDLVPVQGPAVAHVPFVAPGGGAGRLHVLRQGAAVVGAVAQEALDQVRIAGHEARAQARHARALGQALKHQAPVEIVQP